MAGTPALQSHDGLDRVKAPRPQHRLAHPFTACLRMQARRCSLHALKKLPVRVWTTINISSGSTRVSVAPSLQHTEELGADTEKSWEAHGLVRVFTGALTGAQSQKRVCPLPSRPHGWPSCLLPCLTGFPHSRTHRTAALSPQLSSQ